MSLAVALGLFLAAGARAEQEGREGAAFESDSSEAATNAAGEPVASDLPPEGAVALERHAVWPEWTEAWHAVEPLPGERFARLPFWVPVAWNGGEWNRAVRGWAGLVQAPLPRATDGVLEVPPGAPLLARPFAAHRDHMQAVTVSGRFSGPARLVVRGGDGRLFVHDLGAVVMAAPAGADGAAPAQADGPFASDEIRANGARLAVAPGDDGWHSFTWSTPTADLLVPRFEVAVGIAPSAAEESAEAAVARFGPVEVRVPMPTPSVAELDTRVAALVARTLDQLATKGRDQSGPRSTHFWVGLHDVDTGALLAGGGRGPGANRMGYNPVLGTLLGAVEAGLGDRVGPSGTSLAEHLDASARDFLELCVHPETSLPRRFDPTTDKPVDGEPVEAAAYLDFLIDLADSSSVVADDALSAALAMGHALVDYGTLPNGEVAAVVRAADGWTSTSVVHLRRLDVPAQLVRLAALCRERGVEPEFQGALLAAAREAVFEVEYANYWPGSWDRIDPGFDDSYGHIGARSSVMAEAWPEDLTLGRLAESGRRTYLPLWRDALAFGGSVAADQVRCWKIFEHMDALSPAAWSDAPFFASEVIGTLVEQPGHKPRPEDAARAEEYFSRTLRLALANHFVGEATDTAAWLDVTVVGFAPATNLPVGDIIGLPQNLVFGFATLREHERRRGAGVSATQRAMLWTLLDMIEADWGAEFGFADGSRTSGGGIRLAPGLVRWLAAGQ